MPDESPASEPTEVDAVAGFRVEIETRGANVRLEGPGATEARAFALWCSVVERQAKLPRALEGSAAGFQIEQADEALHDRLPGGWAR